MAALAFDPRAPSGVPSIAASNTAFHANVGLMSLAQGTRSKYVTHRLSILTWAIWKGCLAQLLPMSEHKNKIFLQTLPLFSPKDNFFLQTEQRTFRPVTL
jgi:hypothetical protein